MSLAAKVKGSGFDVLGVIEAAKTLKDKAYSRAQSLTGNPAAMADVPWYKRAALAVFPPATITASAAGYVADKDVKVLRESMLRELDDAGRALDLLAPRVAAFGDGEVPAILLDPTRAAVTKIEQNAAAVGAVDESLTRAATDLVDTVTDPGSYANVPFLAGEEIADEVAKTVKAQKTSAILWIVLVVVVASILIGAGVYLAKRKG